MEVNQSIIDQIKDHQNEFPDREVCGFILEGDRCWPMMNISDDPNQFLLDPKELRNVFSQMNPIGMYHTHLDEEADSSDFDKRCIDYSQLPMVIVNKNLDFKIHDHN
jgi:proteasome lid subunit RPN8/RPN11